jgi:tyrosine-protein phosphatase SIW14
MVNRPLFQSLCKSFLNALVFTATAGSLHAQIAASVPAQPAIARASFGAPAEKLKISGVSNAGKISEVLLRGAQPSAQGLAELKKLGVTTIVDLRGNRGPVARERALAESLGMRFVDIPVSGWSPPANAQVAEFLKLFEASGTQKIFVHCYFGSDRTGVMVAAYRMAKQNWTADQAIEEMYSFGFHYHWYPAMKSYVRRFPVTFAGERTFQDLQRGGSAPR